MTTIQNRLLAAIQLRGYQRIANTRSSKFIELRLPSDCTGRSLIKPRDGAIPDHRVLIGKAGALRYTTSSIANSHPFSEGMKARLIAEHVPSRKPTTAELGF